MYFKLGYLFLSAMFVCSMNSNAVPEEIELFDLDSSENFSCASHSKGVECWGMFRDLSNYSIRDAKKLFTGSNGICTNTQDQFECWGSQSQKVYEGHILKQLTQHLNNHSSLTEIHFTKGFDGCLIDLGKVHCWKFLGKEFEERMRTYNIQIKGREPKSLASYHGNHSIFAITDQGIEKWSLSRPTDSNIPTDIEDRFTVSDEPVRLIAFPKVVTYGGSKSVCIQLKNGRVQCEGDWLEVPRWLKDVEALTGPCATTRNGEIVCMHSDNLFIDFQTLDKVAAGQEHLCAIMNDGLVKCRCLMENSRVCRYTNHPPRHLQSTE